MFQASCFGLATRPVVELNLRSDQDNYKLRYFKEYPGDAKGQLSLEGTTVTADTPVREFLEALGLSQHVKQFEEDEVDLPTLAMVLQRQGAAALDEALVELGVNSKGHRMKIRSALG